MFPSKYIQTADVHEPMLVRIAGVRMEEMEDRRTGSNTDKPVVYFGEFEKGMVLNVTNANAIAAIHGDDCEGWIGHQIVIYPTTTEFGGRTVDCIRVRESRRPDPDAPKRTAPVERPPFEEGF